MIMTMMMMMIQRLRTRCVG